MTNSESDLLLESRKRRLKPRQLCYGIGKNDADFCIQLKIDGKCFQHRGYKTWKNIIQRCYSKESILKFPTYASCSVTDEWLNFSGFFKWWKANFREGWVVDKDLLHPGNKIYSPEHCLYVPEALNNFVISREAKRGNSTIGTAFDDRLGMYRASISLGKGRRQHLGTHKTEEDAYAAWLNAKLKLAEQFKPICDEIHPQLYDSLLTKIRSIK
ncbi:hypothetical protein [Enterobacter cloacae]|uniref:hypothetical protein n=1 Tax=Enterobacter cloacae TaxID=550 RepID=UPI002FD7387F